MQSSRKFLFFVFIIFFTIHHSGYAQDSLAANTLLTLKQAVETALTNNVDVNRSQFTSQSSEVNYQQAKGSMLPFLSGSVNHNLNQGRSINPATNSYISQDYTSASYGLNTTIYLWNGNSIRNNVRANELGYEASKMDVQQTKDNLTFNVILAYLQVLTNQELLNAARIQVIVTQQQVDRLNILDKDGAIAPATLYDLKGQLANNELSVVNIKNSLETAKLSLAMLMNVPYSTTIQYEKLGEKFVPIIYDGTVDQVYQQASQMAVIKAAELREKSAAKTVQSAKGQLYPTLSLNGGLGTNFSSAATLQQLVSTSDVQTDNYVTVNNNKVPVFTPQGNYTSQNISYYNQWKNNFNSYAGVTVSIPILNGLQAKSRVRQAKIAEKQASFLSQTTKIQLRQAVDQAYVNMNTSFERYQKSSEQLAAFASSFKAAEVKFDAGVGTSVDYIIAKNNVDNATINVIAAKYEYILRTKVLDYYQSKPLW